MSDILFDVYTQYLINMAIKEGRPFQVPKGLTTLEKRRDKSFFYVLENKFKKEGIKERYQISLFLEIARDMLVNFHISDVVTKFDEIKSVFFDHKEDTVDDKKKKIKIAFAFLQEYCIINNINKYENLLKGNPPVLLKLWKSKKIDERAIIVMFDLEKVKKKTWYRIYCNELITKSKKIQQELKTNIDLLSFIETELVKFKNSLCD